MLCCEDCVSRYDSIELCRTENHIIFSFTFMTPLLIQHSTHYQYSSPVHLGPHRLLLRPRSGYDIQIVSSKLIITPQPLKIAWTRDVYGNSAAELIFDQEPANELHILSEIEIQHYDSQPLDFVVEDRALHYPYLLSPTERIELGPYLIPSYLNDQAVVAKWAGSFWQYGRQIETYALLDQMNRSIASNFAYNAREEPGVQRPEETLETKSGSCRDFAALMVDTCRYLGLPARFVSGYASTEDIPAAMGATHAWTEVYLPGAGWKGFDSTGGVLTGSNHIAVAVGRDPESLPPISGSFTSDDPEVTSSMKVDVSVTRNTAAIQ